MAGRYRRVIIMAQPPNSSQEELAGGTWRPHYRSGPGTWSRMCIAGLRKKVQRNAVQSPFGTTLSAI